MARKASGKDVLEAAKAQLAKANTAEQLRQAQTVVLPLEFGLSLEQTAKAIGLSVGWPANCEPALFVKGAAFSCPEEGGGGRI